MSWSFYRIDVLGYVRITGSEEHLRLFFCRLGMGRDHSPSKYMDYYDKKI
jgi:hypothetical protein